MLISRKKSSFVNQTNPVLYTGLKQQLSTRGFIYPYAPLPPFQHHHIEAPSQSEPVALPKLYELSFVVLLIFGCAFFVTTTIVVCEMCIVKVYHLS